MRTAHKARLLFAVAAVLVVAGCSSPADDSAQSTSTPSPTPETSTAASPTAATSSPAGEAATTLELTASAGVAGRCAPPSPDSLRDLATYAFEGEVTEITDDQITLEPSQWYVDPAEAKSVVVAAPPAAVRDLVQGAQFAVGERYLVAANDEAEVLVCGLTAPATPTGTRLYERAFGQ